MRWILATVAMGGGLMAGGAGGAGGAQPGGPTPPTPPHVPPPATVPRPGGGPGGQPLDAKLPPVNVDPTTAWRDVCRAYRAGPLAERITVTIKPPDRPARRDDITLRLDAGTPKPAEDPGADPGPEAPQAPNTPNTPDRPDRAPGAPIAARPARLALELGPLRIHAASGTLAAIAVGNPATVLRTAVADPPHWSKLGAVLPPLPLPQLEAAFGDPARPIVALLPYAPAVRWTRAVLDPGAEPPTLTLTGDASGATVTLAAHAATGRMVRLSLVPPPPVNGAAPAPTLELSFTPIEPGAPERWAIDVANRREVPTLAELVQRPAPARDGAPAEPPAKADPPGKTEPPASPENPAPAPTPAPAPAPAPGGPPPNH